MASRTDSETHKAIRCVRHAARKLGVSVGEIFKKALEKKDPSEIEEEIEEFESLNTNPDARLPRNYSVPGPVVALAGAIERHSNPQVLLKT